MLGNAYLCTDLSAKLNEWMTQLVIAGDGVCANCGLEITNTVHYWLNATMPTPGKLESVALLEHHGGWLYMRATFDSGRRIDCRFSGDQPITVDLCTEAK
jgi:hypothetical protein